MLPDLSDHPDRMPTRLKLTAVRDRLDSLLDEAGRRARTIRAALTMLCARETARKERAVVRHWSEDNGERRIAMSFGLARFPFHRDLAGFDFAAQPSIDRGRIRGLATGRFIANGEAVLLLGLPGVGKAHLAVAMGREAGHLATIRGGSCRLREKRRGGHLQKAAPAQDNTNGHPGNEQVSSS